MEVLEYKSPDNPHEIEPGRKHPAQIIHADQVRTSTQLSTIDFDYIETAAQLVRLSDLAWKGKFFSGHNFILDVGAFLHAVLEEQHGYYRHSHDFSRMLMRSRRRLILED